MATKKRRSKTPWGWVAFGVGLAVCVGAGGVVGVMLGQSDGESDTDARRVAALALDARGLNEDALSLSRAIEEAIAREELESEAESLRTALARLDTRAEQIRVRAESEVGEAETREVSRGVQRGLGEISNTVTVVERDVVDRLEPVLDEPSSVTAPVGEGPDPSFEEALADVTRVLEEQNEAMTMLAEDLDASGEEADDKSTTEDAAARDEGVASGSFEGALIPPESTLEIDYELEDLEPYVDAPASEPEADASGAGPEEASISSAAAGELTLKNTGSARETFELPTFHLVLYWKESDVPAAAGLRVESPAEDGETIEEGEGVDEGDPGIEGDVPCGYEIEGAIHCALARLAFGEEVDHERNAAGELVLRPDDEVNFDTMEPDGSLTVGKGSADAVAEFIESHPPALVQVLAKEVEAKDFQPACVVPFEWGEYASEGVIVEPYPTTTLGILTGDGEVVFEAGEADRPVRPASGEPEAPECYTLLAEW